MIQSPLGLSVGITSVPTPSNQKSLSSFFQLSNERNSGFCISCFILFTINVISDGDNFLFLSDSLFSKLKRPSNPAHAQVS
jgi:hypothetical protein